MPSGNEAVNSSQAANICATCFAFSFFICRPVSPTELARSILNLATTTPMSSRQQHRRCAACLRCCVRVPVRITKGREGTRFVTPLPGQQQPRKTGVAVLGPAHAPLLPSSVTPSDTSASVCGSGTSMSVCAAKQQRGRGGGGGLFSARRRACCRPAEGQHVDTFPPFPRGVVYGAYP